jgi:hypothetical protein
MRKLIAPLVAFVLMTACGGDVENLRPRVVPLSVAQTESVTGGNQVRELSDRLKNLLVPADVSVSERESLLRYVGANPISRDNITRNPGARYLLIVVGEDGTIHSTDRAFRTSTTGARIDWAALKQATSSRKVQAYELDPGTGPYRRVFNTYSAAPYSDPNYNFNSYDSNPSFESATVMAYCAQGRYTVGAIVNPDNPSAGTINYGQDSGQSYLGGRPYQGGFEIDAGLQYNRFTNGDVNGANDTYTPYLRIPNAVGYDFNVYQGLTGPFVSGNYHIPCNTATTLTFGVEQSVSHPAFGNTPPVLLFMLFTSNSVTYEIYFDPNSTNIGGFDANCNQCQFKMMTSIAEKHPGANTDVFNDFYSYHATWTNHVYSCRFANAMSYCWNSPQGQSSYAVTSLSCSDYPYWSGTYGTGDCYVYTPGSGIAVSSYSNTSEDVTISNATVPTGGPGRCASCGGKRQPLIGTGSPIVRRSF